MTDEHACNLTDHLREQARDQAGDIGNAQQRIEWRAADEIEHLRAIVDRLPVTADGVRVVPGDQVHHPEFLDDRWYAVVRGFDWQDYRDGKFTYAPEDDDAVEIWDRGADYHYKGVNDCYSTREAAEAAAKEKQ